MLWIFYDYVYHSLIRNRTFSLNIYKILTFYFKIILTEFYSIKFMLMMNTMSTKHQVPWGIIRSLLSAWKTNQHVSIAHPPCTWCWTQFQRKYYYSVLRDCSTLKLCHALEIIGRQNKFNTLDYCPIRTYHLNKEEL